MKRIWLALLTAAALICCLAGLAAAEEVLPISPGSSVTTEITLPGEVVIYSYKPAQAGVYRFYSTFLQDYDVDPYGYLVDEDMQLIRSNDDGGEGYNFFMVYQLQANTQYYFAARMFSRNTLGSFAIHLEKTEGVYATTDSPRVYADYNKTGTLRVNAFSPNGGLTYQWYQIVNGTEQLISGATDASYTFPAITETREYKCLVRDAANSSEEVYFTALINCGISISAPSEVYVDLGGSKELKVNVTARYGADRLTYQWYSYDENGDGRAIENANANTLQLTGITESANYWCEITDANGEVRDRWFYIHVDSGLTATASGTTVYNVPYGGTQTLSVVAQSNTDIVKYEWTLVDELNDREEWLYSGTDASYTLNNAKRSGLYRCRVRDAANNSVSVTFRITVAGSFTAAADGKTDFTITAGESCTLKVTTSSTYGELSYQWYKYNNMFERLIPIKGATGSAYTVGDTILPSSSYCCIVSDAAGNQKEISFSVEYNNDFSARRVSDYTLYLDPGEEATLEVEASSTAGKIFYRWFANVYHPEYDDYSDDVVEGARSSVLKVTGTSDHTEYRCVVSDQYGHSQTFWFEVSVDNELTASAVGNTEVTITPGEDVTFAVNAGCKTGNITYQWYESFYDESYGDTYSEPMSGETGATLTLRGVDHVGEYWCRVHDSFGNTEEVWFEVSIENGFSATRVGDSELAVAPGSGATMEVTASCLSGEITYQWYQEIMIEDEGYTVEERINGATESSYTAAEIIQYTNYWCHIQDEYGNYKNLWFYISVDNHLTAEAVGDTEFLVAPGADVEMAVTADCLVGELTYQWYREYYDDAVEGWREERISGATGAAYTAQNVRTADDYRCRVTDQYGDAQSVYFEIDIDNEFAAEAITGNTSYVLSGESFTLAVRASCTDGNITYEWYRYDIDSEGDRTNRTLVAAGTDQYTEVNITEEVVLECRVADAYGHMSGFEFRIIPVDDFYAEADGQRSFTVAPGSSVTMKVRALSSEGEIIYTWYDEDDNVIEGVSGAACTIENVTRYLEYYCRVTDGTNSENVWFEIRIDAGFSAQRVSAEISYIPDGQTEDLAVEATANYGMITYQWFKDGSEIEGAVGSTLTLTVSSGDGGHRYSCDVRNEYGENRSFTFYRFAGSVTALALNETAEVNLTELSKLAACVFVPNETKTYYFYSSSGDDTYGYLFDSNWNMLKTDDDGAIGYNFLISRQLNAGQTYYLGVRYYSADTEGAVPVKVSDSAILQQENRAFTMRVGQSLLLDQYYESNYTSAAADDAAKVQISGRTVTGVSAGTVTVTAKYGQNYAIVYTVNVLENRGVLKLPAGVTVIEGEAFSGDSGVYFVELGSHVSTIESGAFSGTNLVQIVIPADNTIISDGAFGGCTPTIICPKYSEAWYYAERNGLPCLSID